MDGVAVHSRRRRTYRATEYGTKHENRRNTAGSYTRRIHFTHVVDILRSIIYFFGSFSSFLFLFSVLTSWIRVSVCRVSYAGCKMNKMKPTAGTRHTHTHSNQANFIEIHVFFLCLLASRVYRMLPAPEFTLALVFGSYNIFTSGASVVLCVGTELEPKV